MVGAYGSIRRLNVQEYTHEIGGLLLQLADVQLANSSNSAAEQQLDQLTRQALDLVGCLCVVNPGVKAAAMKGKLDTSAEHEPSLMSYSDHQVRRHAIVIVFGTGCIWLHHRSCLWRTGDCTKSCPGRLYL